jgi:beta-lactamase regulating signal transducer with metallopeptidase domain
MSFPTIVALIAFAAYAIVSGLLSGLVGLWWHSSRSTRSLSANEWLAVRLTPPVGAALFSTSVVVPAFLRYEPVHDMERPGFVLVALAMIGAALILDGVRRAVKSYWITHNLLARWGRVSTHSRAAGMTIDIIDSAAPIVAVIGGWRPRMVAARRVLNACTAEELACIVAHERAHLAAKDNLKRFLIAASPDALSWLPLGRQLAQRWRAASEQAADELATGSAPHARLALAAALIKVARLATGTPPALPAISTLIDPDGIETRVERLLKPTTADRRSLRLVIYALSFAALVPAATVLYQPIYRCTEALVGLG